MIQTDKPWLNTTAGIAVLLALLAVPLFGHLDTLPLRLWDESRLAINAYEMMKNGDLIVTHFNGHPDMWNTKPPLLIWCQATLMQLLGVNELAVRLPSAIAALLTCLALVTVAVRYLHSFWFGFIAVMVLITAQGYMGPHAARAGDYDAMLTLFTTVSGLLFFIHCESKRPLHLYLTAVALAVLTKSVTGLLFVPAFVLYALLHGYMLSLLKNRHFYLASALFLGTTLGYYLLREMRNDGYINAVQLNELGGRYLQVIEHNAQSTWFYFTQITTERFAAWHLLLLCGLAVGLVHRDSRMSRITQFSALMVAVFFIVISTSQTKLVWYDVPMYPFMAIIVANFVYFVFELLRTNTAINSLLRYNVAPYILLLLITIGPYKQTLNLSYFPSEHPFDGDFFDLGYYLKDAIRGQHNLNGTHVAYTGINTNNLFYVYILQDKGVNIDFKDHTALAVGDQIVASQKELKAYIEDHYSFQLTDTIGSVARYTIGQRKAQ